MSNQSPPTNETKEQESGFPADTKRWYYALVRETSPKGNIKLRETLEEAEIDAMKLRVSGKKNIDIHVFITARKLGSHTITMKTIAEEETQ